MKHCWLLIVGLAFCLTARVMGDLPSPGSSARLPAAARKLALRVGPSAVVLAVGQQDWRFTRAGGAWALEAVTVRGVPVARPQSRRDSFFAGGGEASSCQVVTDRPDAKAVEFRIGAARATFSARAGDRMPLVHIRLEGVAAPTFVLRSARSDPAEHGAWVTRGWVDTDGGQEAFIDASNPLVFGHSATGRTDAAYLFLPRVHDHIQSNGRTEQRSDTYFQSARVAVDGGFAAVWRLRIGMGEPKEFSVLFDRDLGGRLSDVCERYFAPAVDTLVNLAAVPESFDSERCLQVMPVRLAAPDAFIPGFGWMMTEYPNAAYPYGHDSVFQIAALLAFEGRATRRPWEHNFARYLLDKTPLEGKEGASFFVLRPGGLVRWGYTSDYRHPFPRMDGGSWWTADILYRTALALGDRHLRSQALAMVLHDLNVKLDLKAMTYPPCWNAAEDRVGDDHRDDWFKTPGLAWCAYAAAKIAYPETHDAAYLKKADRICDWFAGFLAPEKRLNFLQGNNMYAAFSQYLALAFFDRYDRSHDRRFLDMARDVAWVHIMTACTTPARDAGGHPLTGATCVGVRGCVDYDCSPNLCQEKDLNFDGLIGPLLDHVSGPAYGKYLKLQQLVLDKDAWQSAWVTELRGTNLRTMYDTYARGMANLIYALEQSSDRQVIAVEKRVSESDTDIARHREIALANPTPTPRETTLRVRYLLPGDYLVRVDGREAGRHTGTALDHGLHLRLPANTMRQIEVIPVQPRPGREAHPAKSAALFDESATPLSSLEPFAAQRGTGLPQPIYRKDRSFGDRPLTLAGKQHSKGLGCASNTVLVYDLEGQYRRFQATVGVDAEVAGATDPPASVFFTAFVDGRLAFESGPMRAGTPPRAVDVDLTGARTLMLRMAGNWDNDGKTENDHGDWADARLAGRTRHSSVAGITR